MKLEWVDHLLAAIFVVVLPAMLLASSRHGQGQGEVDGKPVELTSREKLIGHLANAAFLWVLSAPVLGLWWWRGRPWSDLGLTLSEPRATARAVLGGLVVWLAADTWWHLATPARRAATARRWQRDTPQMPETAAEVVGALPLVVSASICEEVVYRGFLLTYSVGVLAGLPGREFVAAIGLGLVFGLLHRYQGPARMIKVAVLATGMGTLFLLTGSLVLPVALHFAVDLTMMALGPVVAAQRSEGQA